MYKFVGKKGQLYILDIKLNSNCKQEEKTGTGPGSCSNSNPSDNNFEKVYTSVDSKTGANIENRNGKRTLVDPKVSSLGDAYRLLQDMIKDGPLEIPPGDGAISDFRSQAINLASREKLNYELAADRTITISQKSSKSSNKTSTKYIGQDNKSHSRNDAISINNLPKDFLDRKIERGQTIALRYSNDIKRDIKRGYSYGEWGAAPAKTLEEAKEEWSGAHDIKYSKELKGYLPIEPGLSTISSAWSSEGMTVREAIQDALGNAKDVGGGSFDSSNTPLYVLIGKAGKEDSNGYDTIREPTDYYRIEIPWKKNK